MSPTRLYLKASVVVGVGLFAMHVSSRSADAATRLDPACIHACCFCIQSCEDVPFTCADQGCGPEVGCSDFDQRCDNVSQDKALLECQDPA